MLIVIDNDDDAGLLKPHFLLNRVHTYRYLNTNTITTNTAFIDTVKTKLFDFNNQWKIGTN